MKKLPCLIAAILISWCSNAAEKASPDSSKGKEYSFILQDSPALISTMRQSNENLLSFYRLGVRALNQNVSHEVSSWIQIAGAFLFIPLTHEEGHRSILSAKGIGSISRPYFNKEGAGYVYGVTDQTLQDLRTTDLKSYIRLHTAGLESDYTLWCRESNLIYEQKEDLEVLQMELLYRKFTLMSYYLYGLLGANINITEEANELDRDIVGHDVYGAIKNLYRPAETFYRYTDYRDLTSTEKKYAKRVGMLTLLNMVDPLMYSRKAKPFTTQNGLRYALGYNMCPFGDYVDERFWWKKNGFLTEFYFRQYQNRTHFFPEIGLSFPELLHSGPFQSNLSLTAWSQPKDLLFESTTSQLGGSADLRLQYVYVPRQKNSLKAISFDLGLVAKTQGFMVEETSMGNHFGIRFGTSVWW